MKNPRVRPWRAESVRTFRYSWIRNSSPFCGHRTVAAIHTVAVLGMMQGLNRVFCLDRQLWPRFVAAKLGFCAKHACYQGSHCALHSGGTISGGSRTVRARKIAGSTAMHVRGYATSAGRVAALRVIDHPTSANRTPGTTPEAGPPHALSVAPGSIRSGSRSPTASPPAGRLATAFRHGAPGGRSALRHTVAGKNGLSRREPWLTPPCPPPVPTDHDQRWRRGADPVDSPASRSRPSRRPRRRD